MKSCLVPPNLNNAGDSSFANVRSFGELGKVNAKQMCKQQGLDVIKNRVKKN